MGQFHEKYHKRYAPYLFLLGLVIFVGISFAFLTQKHPDIADTMGYAYAGQRLAAGYGLTFEDPNNELAGTFFSLFAFQIRHNGDSRLFLGFPPGFPLLLASGILMAGPTAVYYVVPVLAMLGTIVTFWLGKLISRSNWVGLLAAFIVATVPLYWQFGTDIWSEVPAMVSVTIGVCFYIISRQSQRPFSQILIFSMLGGLFLSYSLFIRYANITFLVAIGITELVTVRSKLFRQQQRWIFYGISGLGLITILIFNHFYYGGITLTSYSPENGWYAFSPFSLKYSLGPPYSFIEAAKTLWANFSVLLLLVPVGWAVMKRPFGLLTALSITSSITLYSIYAFAPAGINARFLVPILPFIAVSIASAFQFIIHKLPNPAWQLISSIILIAFLVWPVPKQIQQLQTRNTQASSGINYLYDWVKDTPQNAVFLSYTLNDHLIYYATRSVLNYRRIPRYSSTEERYRYELFEPCLVHVVDTLLINQTPVLYIEDGDPPLYDSLNVLQKYYNLELIRDVPKIYKVYSDDLIEIRESSKACNPE